jgi:hypothetical protein
LAKGWDCQRGQQYHYYSFLHCVHFLVGREAYRVTRRAVDV